MAKKSASAPPFVVLVKRPQSGMVAIAIVRMGIKALEESIASYEKEPNKWDLTGMKYAQQYMSSILDIMVAASNNDWEPPKARAPRDN